MSTDPTTRPIYPSQKGTRYQSQDNSSWGETKRKTPCGCCGTLVLLASLMVFIASAWVYITAPGRTNILILGIDSRENSNLGRSDTMILTTFIPAEPYIGMLSIPRDLWVSIPGYENNRINAAHFFGEAEQPSRGPELAVITVSTNFGVNVDYYLRVNLIGFLDFVDSLGGIDINLPRPMSGYEAGVHHLNGEQALALVRDRAGSDDFSRMERGQIFISAVMKQFLSPSNWLNIPTSLNVIQQYVDTNIPIWQFPRLAFTLYRIGTDGIQSAIINRDMVNPFVSGGGANVLAPRWEVINPVLMEIFGQ